MKIMCVARVYPWHRPGGMPFVTQDRAPALAKLGHEVVVVTTAMPEKTLAHEPPGGFAGQCEDDWGPTIVALGDVPPQRWTREFAEACDRFADYFQPAVIHSDSFDNSHPWWADRPECVAVTMHGFTAGGFLTETTKYRLGLRSDPPAFDSVGNLREARALAKANVVIGISHHEKRLIEEYYGVRAKLVYNPIAPYFFEPAHGSQELAPIPDDAYVFCAGNPGTSGNRLFDMADRACRRVGLQCRIVSDVPRREMPALYDGCLCYVLPTVWHTGFDLAVCEANARGRMVFASHVGTYATEKSERAMRTFPPGDENALVAYLEIQKAARVRAMPWQRHWPEHHAAAWIQVFMSHVGVSA